MPPVLIPIVTAALTSAGISATAGITVFGQLVTYSSIIANAIVTVASLGASYALAAASQKKQKGDTGQVQLKQALPPRMRIIARDKVSGAMAFTETASPSGALHQVIIHAEGESDGIEEWWLNDTKLNFVSDALPSNGNATNLALPWYVQVSIESHLGADEQAASPVLLARFPSLWTANHKLNGLCYSVLQCNWVRQEDFGHTYPNGVPGLRVVMRAEGIYDPRTDTTAWTDNAGLWIRHYLTLPRGFNINAARINEASFSAFADLCDELVELKNGDTEKRYTVIGNYLLNEAPAEVLRRLLAACDAELQFLPDGTIGISGGQWEEPTIEIDDSMMLDYNYEQGNDKLAAFNQVKLSYKSPLHDYQIIETEAWDDLEAQDISGEINPTDLTLEYVGTHSQARRLAKIATYKGNPRHRLHFAQPPGGIRALGQRVLWLTIAELGIIHEAFRVVPNGSSMAGDLGQYNTTLESLPAEAYAWDPETEEGDRPPIPVDPNAPAVPPVPTGMTLSLVRSTPSPGIVTTRILADVDDVALTWETIGRYRKTGTLAWTVMSEDSQHSVLSDIADDGAEYDVQTSHTGYGREASGQKSDWTEIMTITVTADDEATDPPTDLAVDIDYLFGPRFTWTNPPQANYWQTLLYRGSTNVFADSTLVATINGTPGQPGSTINSTPAGTWYWWAVATNRSGTPSAPSDPVTDTKT